MSVNLRSFYTRSSWRRALLASIAMACSLAVPVVTRAERPATLPALPRVVDHTEQKDRSDRERRSERDKADKGEKGDKGDSGDRGDRGGRGFGPRKDYKISDEEWVEIAKFMSENSPNLWAVYEKLPEKHKNGARYNIARRYLSLRNLSDRDPQLYEIELKRVKIEDGIFGILGDIRKTGDKEPEAQKRLKQELRDKVEELWAVRMEDREVQLARIERQLQGFRMSDTLAALHQEKEADASAERRAEWVQARYAYLLGHVGGRPGMLGPGMIPGGRGRPNDRPASRDGEDRKDGERKAAGPSTAEPARGAN
jgi:hypothetical protein